MQVGIISAATNGVKNIASKAANYTANKISDLAVLSSEQIKKIEEKEQKINKKSLKKCKNSKKNH